MRNNCHKSHSGYWCRPSAAVLSDYGLAERTRGRLGRWKKPEMGPCGWPAELGPSIVIALTRQRWTAFAGATRRIRRSSIRLDWFFYPPPSYPVMPDMHLMYSASACLRHLVVMPAGEPPFSSAVPELAALRQAYSIMLISSRRSFPC